jgi:DNA-binding NtrC family response regulator
MKPRTTSGRKPAKKSKGGPRTHGRLQRALDNAAEVEIRKVLGETGGNVTHAAAALGISQPALLRRIGALGIATDHYRR